MTIPGSPAHQLPRGNDWMVRKIADLERKVNRLVTAQSLQAAVVGKGGLRSADFDGTLDPPTVGTQGWGLGSAAAIFGSILLRDAIIGDDALENPVSPLAVHNDSQTFGLTPAGGEKCRATVTPPPGFTRALVLAAATGNCLNSTASQDYLIGYVDINGVNTGWNSQSVAFPGGATTVVGIGAALVDPAPPNFYIRAMLSSGIGSWASSSLNVCNVDAVVLFLR